MVKIDLKYLGDLHTEAIHQPSQTQLVTDAPVDNQGRGESFSPTDLVATGLGTCMITTMAIVAQRHQIDLKGSQVSIEKMMSQESPRRIRTLNVHLKIPIQVSEEQQKLLENAARRCPVSQSLHPEVEKNMSFEWGVSL